MLILIRNPVTAIKSWFKNPWFCATGARVCATLGFEETALGFVEQALQEHPHRADLHLRAGRLCFKLGRIDRAVWHIKRVWPYSRSSGTVFYLESAATLPELSRNPKDQGWMLAAIGSHLLSAGEPGRALAYFNRAIATGLDHSAVLNQKGLCLLSLDQPEEALKLFQEARVIGGRNVAVLINTALALNRLGRFAEALRCYEEAQGLGAEGAGILNNKGFSLFHLRRYEEAAACFELARELDPQETVTANLALCHFKSGRVTEAFSILRGLVERQPEDAVLLNNLAVCMETTERRLEALALYKKAVTLGGPERQSFLINQAACLAGLQRFEEALVLLEDALKSVPADARVWSLKASILAELGHQGEASDCYRRAFGLTG
ncbi:MAG TPA: tetratricopeptide repeat protein [Desulfotomaculum sp.]|nr:tetratricopeptide repeat protein [Desulfotomaculum sp.]